MERGLCYFEASERRSPEGMSPFFVMATQQRGTEDSFHCRGLSSRVFQILRGSFSKSSCEGHGAWIMLFLSIREALARGNVAFVRNGHTTAWDRRPFAPLWAVFASFPNPVARDMERGLCYFEASERRSPEGISPLFVMATQQRGTEDRFHRCGPSSLVFQILRGSFSKSSCEGHGAWIMLFLSIREALARGNLAFVRNGHTTAWDRRPVSPLWAVFAGFPNPPRQLFKIKLRGTWSVDYVIPKHQRGARQRECCLCS